MGYIDTFSSEISYEFFRRYKENIHRFLKQQQKEYIIGVNEEEYIQYLFDKFLFQPLEIIENSKVVLEPEKLSRPGYVPALDFQTVENFYRVPVEYAFIGTKELFRVMPSTRKVTSYEVYIHDDRDIVRLIVDVNSTNVDQFNIALESAYKKAFDNIININRDVDVFNNELKTLITSAFKKLKDELIGESTFFASIMGGNTNPSVYEVPIIRKNFAPKFIAANNSTDKVPYLGSIVYRDVLEKIYNCGRSIEQKTSMYRGKDEEALRDIFLLYLENRYDNTTISGETFNKDGKTDILIKHTDGSNLFVAECKFWGGQKVLESAINQLFDKYLTWRDSKAALIFFVDNKKISDIGDVIKSSVVQHKYFLENGEQRNDSSHGFRFHLPNDENAKVDLEILFFHYPKE